MSWYSVLKACIGNWAKIFRDNAGWPTKEIIEALDEEVKKNKARELATTLDRIETEMENLSELINEQGPEKPQGRQPEGNAERAMWPRRKPVVPLEKLKIRLEKLKSYISLMGAEGTFTKRQVKEELQPLVNTFAESRKIDDFIALYNYVSKMTDGNMTNKAKITQKWMRNLDKIIDVPDEFLSAIDANWHHYTDNQGKQIKSLFNLKEQIGDKTGDRRVLGGKRDEIIDEEDPLYQKKKGGLQTAKTRKVADQGTTTVREITTEAAFPVTNLNDKISNLTLREFRRLMKLLHTSTVTKGTVLQPYKGTSVDILHDIAIVRMRTLNGTIRLVDFGRKGISVKHRKGGAKTDFAIAYVKEQMEIHNETFSIGNYQLEPFSNTGLDDTETRKNNQNKQKAINYVKNQLDKGEGSDIYDRFREFIRTQSRAKTKAKPLMDRAKELAGTDDNDDQRKKLARDIKQIYEEAGLGVGTGTIEHFLGQSDDNINYTDIIEHFPIESTETFVSNIFVLLFKYAVISENEAEFEDKVKHIISLKGNTGNFVEYIPTGNVFQNVDEESLVDTIRTILTFIITFYDKEFLLTYNEHMTNISQEYYDTVEKAIQELAESVGIEDVEESREELYNFVSDGLLQQLGIDQYTENLFGIKDDLKAAKDELDKLLLELDNKVISLIHDLISEIGSDTTDKYTQRRMKLKNQQQPIQKHLIDMGLLVAEQPAGDEEE